MSRFRFGRAVTLASLVTLAPLAAAHAAGDAAAPPAPPSPPALPGPSIELKELDLFLGHWNCKGQVPASPMGPAHASETDVDITKALDGYWLTLDLREKRTAENPHPFAGLAHWGYDPGRKLFVERWVDSSGAYSEQTSAGWNGDTIVFVGDMLGGEAKIPVRDNFVRKSKDELDHHGEAQFDGEWRTMVKDTCKRVAR